MQTNIKVYGLGSQGFPTVFLIAGQLKLFHCLLYDATFMIWHSLNIFLKENKP